MSEGGTPPPPRRARPWIVLSLEEAVLDVRPAILSVIHLLSGATPADVAVLEATGELDDPWDLARAAHPWIRAGRPKPLPEGGWRVIVNRCGNDPGDLHGRAARLYAEREWRQEASRLALGQLARLTELAHVAVVTDRDRAGLARAEHCVGHRFEHATTAEDGARPAPAVLLRHAERGHFVGRGPRDRATAEAARFVFHDCTPGASVVVERILTRLAEPIAVAPPPEERAPDAPAPTTGPLRKVKVEAR